MITANEAYAATTKVLEDKYVQEISKVEDYIKAAINDGHYSCELNKLSDKLTNELIDAGYKVEHFYDTSYYNDEYFVVSWIINHEGE